MECFAFYGHIIYYGTNKSVHGRVQISRRFVDMVHGCQEVTTLRNRHEEKQVGDSIFEIYNSLRSVMPIHVLLSNVYFNL